MRHRLFHLLLTLTLLATGAARGAEGGRIAITVDDLPFASATPMAVADADTLNRQLLAALKRHGVKATGFVNESRLLVPGQLDRSVAILDAWLDAGMELGNHGFAHLGLWQSSLADVQADVLKGEVITRWLTSRRQAPLRYYRPPFTQTGRSESDREAFEAFLAAQGYTVAPMTVDDDDYVFACVYDHLGSPADAARRRTVEDEYDAHLRVAMATFERMSQELFGRAIPHVLVLHASRLNAATLHRTLSTLEDLGYAFVSLEDALADEAYRSPARASGRFGPSWLARWARARGTRLSVYGQPDPQGQTMLWHRQMCGG